MTRSQAFPSVNTRPKVTDWESIEQYRRITKETQYLILPLREVGHLYGGNFDVFQAALEKTKQLLGPVEDPKRRRISARS